MNLDIFTRDSLGSFYDSYHRPSLETQDILNTEKRIRQHITDSMFVPDQISGNIHTGNTSMFDSTLTWRDISKMADELREIKRENYSGLGITKKEKKLKHKKVIFNDPATIVIWEDVTRTVVKTCEGDTFDKTTGFLQAYFQKVSGMSKTQSSKFLRELTEEV